MLWTVLFQKLKRQPPNHMAEALFKAFGKALDMAVSPEPRMTEIWSTKGAL